MRETLKFYNSINGLLLDLRYNVSLQEKLNRKTRDLIDEIDDVITDITEQERLELKETEKTFLKNLVRNEKVKKRIKRRDK